MALKRATPRINVMDAVSDRAELLARNRTGMARVGYIGSYDEVVDGVVEVSVEPGLGNILAVPLCDVSVSGEYILLNNGDSWWVIGRPARSFEPVDLRCIPTQSIPNDTWTTVNLSVDGYSPFAGYPVPARGKYFLSGGVVFNGVSGLGQREAVIYHGPPPVINEVINTRTRCGAIVNQDVPVVCRTAIIQLDEGDVVQMRVKHTAGAAITINPTGCPASLTIIPL